jgi:hypothetical protein
MVWCNLLMVDCKFFSLGFDYFIDEMCALITHIGASKLGYYVIKYKMHSCSCTTVLYCSCFSPSSQVFCCSNDIPRSCALSWCCWGKTPYRLTNRVQTLHADMTEEKLFSTFIPRFKSPFLSKCMEISTYLISDV